ncbi:MAG: winged helix-turn-helix transcriptional regulator [Verrucomicrobiota bacterium]
MANTKTTSPGIERRSPCPVACSLDIFGDRWTLLVIRDLVLGRSRFKDFTASPEGIPTNILSDRLERLQTAGIITQVTPPDGSKHRAYQLTTKGEALRPVLGAMRDWGLTWEKGTKVLMQPVPPSTSAVKSKKQNRPA